MNKQTSLGKGGSLLERAAEVYDFHGTLSGRPATVPGADAEVPAPAPEATPSSEAETLDLGADQIIHSPAEPETAPQAQPAPQARKPRHAGKPKRFLIDRERLREGGFIVPEAPTGALAEEFRIIKRQLLQQSRAGSDIAEDKRQVILVASAQPADGKSFCALNLALSIAAERDVEVLLVDGDFAKPALPAALGLEAGPGFIDAIADASIDPNDLVVPTDIEGLSLLPAGKQANNVTELIASARTREVLRALTEGHQDRILIFDSTPALVASPASVLASHAGQVMMVVRADCTTEADLRESLSLLSSCASISLVLNGTRLMVSGPRFGVYYGNDQ